MPKRTQEHKNIDIYVKLPRFLHSDYLQGKLRFEEFLLLVWLWLQANPYNARVSVSYEGLAKDMSGRYSKNHLNKLMLAVKRKKYLSFPRQQGRRSSFEVALDRYPLTNGRYSSIGKHQQNSGRGPAVSRQRPGRTPSEVGTPRQKLQTAKESLAKRLRIDH